MKYASLGLVVIVATSLFVATPTYGTPEIGKKEKLRCTVCHDKSGSRLLTDKGMYYQLKGTLQDYKLLIHVYKKCTACHSREPGDKTLTPKGEELKVQGVTMEHFGTTPPKK